MSCIYKIFYTVGNIKQITSPGWMHETSARTWCTWKTQRDWVEREVGGGIRMGKTCKSILIHVNVWQKPLQYCKVISLQLKKKKKNFTISFPKYKLYQIATSSLFSDINPVFNSLNLIPFLYSISCNTKILGIVQREKVQPARVFSQQVVIKDIFNVYNEEFINQTY